MKKIIQVVSSNILYSICFILFVISASLFLFVSGDKQAFLKLNGFHSNGLDNFFLIYDYVGNGIFSVVLGVILLIWKRIPLAIQVLAAYLLSGLIAQIIKNLVYSSRPRLVFDASVYTHFIDGVSLANGSGFPSGHTASAFALATILALHTKNKKISVLYLAAAMLAGYTRIYLGQHFLADVLAGALIGTITSFCVYTFMLHSNFKIPFKRKAAAVKHK